MKRITVRTKQNVFDGTYIVSLMDGDIEMIMRSHLEESDIFPTIIELTQIANKYGYTVER